MANSNKPHAMTHRPASSGRTYWQSFEHLAESDEVREIIDREFAGYDPEAMRTLSRRRFLKYVAASMALAGVGLAGCRRWPKEILAPYAYDPTHRTPGIAEYYATSWELGGVGHGLLAESFDGRPIKLEGNPSHPGNVTRSGRWASADSFAQAQPLSLYDPDRSRTAIDWTGSAPVSRDIDWVRQNVVPQLQQADGGSMAVLCEATSSPTLLRLRDELAAAKPGLEWYTWEPLLSAETSAATNAAYGRDLRPLYSLDKALVVVSLDDDYLGNTHPAHTRYAADWSVLRAAADPTPAGANENAHGGVRMSRCYNAESRYSITGASGDIRLPIQPSRLRTLAQGIAAQLGVAGVQTPELSPREVDFVTAAAADLEAHRGESLLAFGSHLPADVQQLAMAINSALGNVGQTIRFIDNPAPAGAPIEALVERMRTGEIGTLLILGGNPVYNAPADLAFAEALAQVPLSVHLSLYVDETSQRVSYHVPRSHFLEHWGDTRGWDGTIAPIQPLILPLFNGLSSIELVALVTGLDTTDGYALVRETFAGLTGETASQPAFDPVFRKVLHDGILEGSAFPVANVGEAAPPTAGEANQAATEGQSDQFEVVFFGDSTLYDGRFANNGWLQELPEPLSKLTWDNAALMNIHDAEALGVRTNDVIELTVDGRTLGIAVYVLPGQPRGVIGLPLGYGRTAGGSLAVYEDNTGGGFDTYRLRTRQSLYFAAGATATRQGQQYVLAMTQNHHLIDNVGYAGREKRVGMQGEPGTIIRESTFLEHKDFVANGHGGRGGGGGGGGHHNSHPAHKGQHGAISLQIFNPPDKFNTPHAWGMTIDMTTCIGCSACVVACQSENNIPIVGKESVLNNREMHWLRIDRYFKGSGESIDEKKHDDNPDVTWQPMFCVHCENAPCEQVCPVAATVHDTEGLNTMVYNRCIGTRYCSNNCPYKVRRFNYLDWHYKDARRGTFSGFFAGLPDQQQSNIDAIKQMVFNPDVTVRMRGVMEKCTYCTQRIEAQTIRRKNEHRAGEREIPTVDDGDILTACQQACPTESIIFGNLNDQAARVTKQQQSSRAYGVLDELNTRPRTKHLARLRNRQELPNASQSEEPTSS